MEQPHSVEQAEAVVNPNQTWFPHVLQFALASKLGVTVPKGYHPKETYIADIVHHEELPPDMPVTSSDGWLKGFVKQVLESRPAKGDWDKPYWQGIHPNWYRCLVTLAKPEE